MTKKLLQKLLTVPVLSFAIIGCSHAMKHEEKTYKTPPVDAPFFITFDAKGEPMVIGRDGKRIDLSAEPIKIPRPASVVRATNISALEVHGSHYYLLYINGEGIMVPIPHY